MKGLLYCLVVQDKYGRPYKYGRRYKMKGRYVLIQIWQTVQNEGLICAYGIWMGYLTDTTRSCDKAVAVLSCHIDNSKGWMVNQFKANL